MNVLHPAMAAVAIASVAVPILIHLLLRRRKRIIKWAAMDLLERALRRDRRRQRIERWMLLAARCLLLVVAGIALARPFAAPGSGVTGAPSRTLWLVVDDGVASAERMPEGGTALERQVAEARRAVAALAGGDRVGLITAAEPARRLIDPPTADLSRVESFLSTLSPAYTGSDLAGALREAATAAGEDEDGRVDVLLLSSFRRGSLDVSTAAPALAEAWPRGARLFATPVPATASNNAIVAEIEALRRGDEATSGADRPLRVRIDRDGDLPRTSRRVTAAIVAGGVAGATGGATGAGSAPGAGGGQAVDLILDAGERRASAEMRIRAGVESSGTGRGGASGLGAAVEVALDEDAQPRDDRGFAILPAESAPRVVVLDRRTFTGRADLERLSSGAWMARAVEPGRGARAQVDEIDPGSLDRALVGRSDVIIVARPDLVTVDGWTLLGSFVDDGGALVVAPSPDDGAQRWVERFRTVLAPSWRIDPEPEVASTPWRLAPQQASSSTLRMLGSELSALGAPVRASRRIRAEAPASDAETPLVFEDGAPLLLAGRAPSQRGWVALLTVAPELDWTDLPVRPLMVPLMQELVRQGRTLARSDVAAFVGTRVSAPRGATSLVRRGAGSDTGGAATAAIVVGPEGRTREIAVRPGVYDAIDESGRAVGAVAVNVDARRASIEANAPEAVRAWLQPTGRWAVVGDEVEEADVTAREADAPWSVVLLVIAATIAVTETVLARILSRPAITDMTEVAA